MLTHDDPARTIAQNDTPLELAVSHTERAPNLVAMLIEYGVTVQPVTYDDDGRAAAPSRAGNIGSC